jgi:glycosyltransferase involved in cell wall biosynthesis
MLAFSVIIPTYNRCVSLQRALLSVQQQTLPAQEIIVVDDGSRDNTAELISRQFPDVRLIRQSNRGVSSARNVGIKAARCEWLAFLDSDDLWYEKKLAMQSQALSDLPEYRICHSDEIWFRNAKRVQQKKHHRKYGGWIYHHCLPLCVISPSAVVLQRSLFDEVGLFDESLPACEDYDLWLRICSRFPVLFCPQVLLRKTGGHNDQLSRRYWGMDRFRVKALEKILRQAVLTAVDRQQTLQMLLEKLNILKLGAEKRHKLEDLASYALKIEYYRQQLELNYSGAKAIS